MTVLEALIVLESATLECKKREINTPEVRQALQLLEPYIQPPWLVAQFYQETDPLGDKVVDRDGQQQVLRPTFEGIRDSVRELVEKKMDALALQLTVAHDTKIKVEVDHLKEANLSVNAIAERKPEF